MSLGLSTALTITLGLLGVAGMIMPVTLGYYHIGIIMWVLAILSGLWTLLGWLYFRRLERLIVKRVHVQFLKANFDAIGMSSPYIDFYFNVHSYLSNRIMLTGQKRGELWNPHIEAWRSGWDIDTNYQCIIGPDTDTGIRIRWVVPQGHNSPMSEFAFRAKDNPPEQQLTFEDMGIELKTQFLGLERKIGWLQLAGVTDVSVPNHIAFETVRKEYERQAR